MKVALYHNLPPGGARRALWEFVRRTSDVHEYDLYTVDMGRADDFAYARSHDEHQDLGPFVAHSFRYPLGGLGTKMPLGKMQVLDAVRRIRVVNRQVARDINRGGYDVAYVHSCQLTHTPSVLGLLQVPSLHYMQEPRRRSFEAGYGPSAKLTGVTSFPRWAVMGWLEHTLRQRDISAVSAADRIACNSYYSAESIHRSYGRDATVCYLGVDTDAFTTGPAGRRRSLRAMSVGALERAKGHDLVVRALAMIPQRHRPTLDVVYERCDFRYRGEVQALARSLAVAVEFHQGISDSALAELYRRSSVTVVAAQLEPFGLVPIESFSCGTPVVAVREAGYRETVEDGVNGYLVERSPAELADGVTRVLRGDLATSAGAVRNSVLSKWDWDTAVKHQLELLSTTAGEG